MAEENKGWLPAYRRIFEADHWLAPTKAAPASTLHAWLDLCQMATYQPRETRASGTLGRGELVVSVRTLAKRWGWSKSRVGRFARELEARTAVRTLRGTPDGTVYRIVNYERYAISRDSERDTDRDRVRDDRGTAAGQEQEGKKEIPPVGPPAKRRARMPPDWSPNDTHRTRAETEGVDIDREAEKFRSYHESQGSRFLSWDQAFTTWLLKAGEYAKAKPSRRRELQGLDLPPQMLRG